MAELKNEVIENEVVEVVFEIPAAGKMSEALGKEKVQNEDVIAIDKASVVSVDDHEPHVPISIVNSVEEAPVEEIDYKQGGRWGRSAELSFCDGLASLAIVIGQFKDVTKFMLFVCFEALVMGACGAAVGKLVAASTQRDSNEVSQSWRRGRRQSEEDGETMERQLTVTNHLLEALTSWLAYAVGGMIPLAALTCTNHEHRLALLVGVASFAQSYKSAKTTRA